MIKVTKMLTKNQYVRIDATLNYLFELLFGYMCLDGKMTLLMNVEHWIFRCFVFLVSFGTRYVHQPELRWLYSKGSLRRSGNLNVGGANRMQRGLTATKKRQAESENVGNPGFILTCTFHLYGNEDHKQQIYMTLLWRLKDPSGTWLHED